MSEYDNLNYVDDYNRRDLGYTSHNKSSSNSASDEEMAESLAMSKVGPGMWYVTHKKAAEATTAAKKREFEEYVEWLKQNIPCAKCKAHFIQLNEQYPLSEYSSMNQGYARWSWIIHNAVNNVLGKPIVTWESFVAMYLEKKEESVEICSKQCEGTVTPSSNVSQIVVKSSNPKTTRMVIVPRNRGR